MRILCIALSMLLTACAAIAPQRFVGPNGRPAYSIQCSGIAQALDDCYRSANAVCSGWYTIIERTSAMVPIPIQGGMFDAPQHKLTVECR